jgi:hypothetical protein
MRLSFLKLPLPRSTNIWEEERTGDWYNNCMTPDEALQRQIELYRAMTGEQRLRIALDLHKFACDVAREGIRHQFPSADEAEVERQFRRRIELGRKLSKPSESSVF